MFARAIALLFLLPITAAAQNASQFSLSIEPAVLHISVAAGARYEGVINVRNKGATTLHLNTHAYDFIPVDESGGVKLQDQAGPVDTTDPINAAGWIKFPEGVISSSPGKTLKIPYVLTVPDDASPGARSLALVLDVKGGSVGTRFESLMFLDIPGDAKTAMEILDFSQESLFNANSSGIFHLKIKNTGKTHLRPEGELVVRNMFGAERDRFSLMLANSVGTVPPGSVRSIDYQWKGSHGAVDFGLWNAKVHLKQDEVSIADRSFFLVLPWRAVAISFLAIGGSLFLLRRSLMRMRREVTHLEESKKEGELPVMPLALVVLAGAVLFITTSYILFDFLSASHEGLLEKITTKG